MQIKTVYSPTQQAWWYYVTDPVNPENALLVSPASYPDEKSAFVAGELSQVNLQRVYDKWESKI